MATPSDRHKAITSGKGWCSRPMWIMGVPAGFCDKEAYEPQRNPYLNDTRPYVPDLACPTHGGPTLEQFLAGKTVVRFSAPPGPDSEFVEVERDGKSFRAGTWVQDGDDWLLVLDSNPELTP